MALSELLQEEIDELVNFKQVKEQEKILRQIKRVIKLNKEKEKIEKSLDYYRMKFAEYVQKTGKEGGGFSYGMRSKINEDMNITASPLFSWNKSSNKIDKRVSVHFYNKKTNENFDLYSRKD